MAEHLDNGDKKQIKWFVMRSYKNERRAIEALSHKTYGLEHFIPMEQVIRERMGKKMICTVPVIPSLIFVRSSQEKIVQFKHTRYADLQFVIWNREGNARYLTVPDKEMHNFMLLYAQRQHKVVFYHPNDERLKSAIASGQRVRVHGGVLDTLEGYAIRVGRKHHRQIVVIIPDTIAISSAQVGDGIIEVIK